MQILDVEAHPVSTIPLREVSGLALGQDPAGRITLVAIGDRAAVVAWCSLAGGLGDLAWRTEDLSASAGTRIPAQHPQLEAVAVDGSGGLLLVQEFPNRAEFIDAPGRRVIAHITLEMPQVPQMPEIRRTWADPEGSHAEGAVLLRGGRLLVVKEKDPAALLEFGPAGQSPRGFGPAQWLAPGEPWPVAEGEVTLTALAAWYPDRDLRQVCPDLSDAAVGILGNLVLLSDRGSAVAVVGAHPPGEDPYAGRFSAQLAWRVHGVAEKPEGVAMMPDGDVLIACDLHKVKPNLFVVRRADWMPDR